MLQPLAPRVQVITQATGDVYFHVKYLQVVCGFVVLDKRFRGDVLEGETVNYDGTTREEQVGSLHSLQHHLMSVAYRHRAT